MRVPSRLLPILAVVVTLAALIALPSITLSGDLTRLFPDDAAARALRAYVRAFGGGDVSTVLVRGDDPGAVEGAAREIADGLRDQPGIRRAVTSLAPGAEASDQRPDPTLAWAFADATTTRALDDAVSDEGMRRRLEETRALLLAPGTSGATDLVRADPLRLWAVVQSHAKARSVGATVGADSTGDLVADGGHARFVLVTAEGSALHSADAARTVAALDKSIARATPSYPGVNAAIAGGPAIARDVERLIRRDLYVSSALSSILVAIAFVVTFGRARALVAVVPPLMMGTVCTAALSVFFPGGLAAPAMGFASVVIGVGLDTGVHVYAAVMREARVLSSGAPSRSIRAAIADAARRAAGPPTLTAAVAAAFAFGALGLSSLPALRQLGALCAAGEVLTALAILAITPTLAAYLENGGAAVRPVRSLEWIADRASSPRGAGAIAAVLLAVGALSAILGAPRPSSAIVAMKPRGLPSLVAQDAAIRLVSGKRSALEIAGEPASESTVDGGGEVQLTVIQRGSAAMQDELLDRGEALRLRLERQAPTGVYVESLTTWVPAPSAVVERISHRDRLDLPRRAAVLERLLSEQGFATGPFASVLAQLRAPASAAAALDASKRARDGALASIAARHLARDADAPGALLLATYVRGPRLDAAQLTPVAREVDPSAVVTGYPVLEASLRRALARDLPRVALVALICVTLALRTVLRSWREVLVALFALAAELLIVALVVRIAAIPIHVYDALVLPVLLGITVDESMFLLHAAESHGSVREAFRREGRAVVTTATTTAVGFGALLSCGFPGLRDLGAVGFIGSLAGLVTSVAVVPAAMRWTGLGAAAEPEGPRAP